MKFQKPYIIEQNNIKKAFCKNCGYLDLNTCFYKSVLVSKSRICKICCSKQSIIKRAKRNTPGRLLYNLKINLRLYKQKDIAKCWTESDIIKLLKDYGYATTDLQTKRLSIRPIDKNKPMLENNMRVTKIKTLINFT